MCVTLVQEIKILSALMYKLFSVFSIPGKKLGSWDLDPNLTYGAGREIGFWEEKYGFAGREIGFLGREIWVCRKRNRGFGMRNTGLQKRNRGFEKRNTGLQEEK